MNPDAQLGSTSLARTGGPLAHAAPEEATRRQPSLRLVEPPPAPAVHPSLAPLSAPGSSFETRRLEAVGGNRLALARTWQERAFIASFVAFGIAIAATGLGRLVGGSATGLDANLWLPLLAGALLVGVAALLARSGGHAVLDGEVREFRRDAAGSLPARPDADGGHLVRVAFDEVAAVQRLRCLVADEEARWTIHQINLVRHDGSRVHVCSHAEEALARRGAETIARFVGVGVMPQPGEH